MAYFSFRCVTFDVRCCSMLFFDLVSINKSWDPSTKIFVLHYGSMEADAMSVKTACSLYHADNVAWFRGDVVMLQ